MRLFSQSTSLPATHTAGQLPHQGDVSWGHAAVCQHFWCSTIAIPHGASAKHSSLAHGLFVVQSACKLWHCAFLTPLLLDSCDLKCKVRHLFSRDADKGLQCREKELLRALAAQERQATRLRQRDVNTGPKDDLDIEWEQLMEAHHQAGYSPLRHLISIFCVCICAALCNSGHVDHAHYCFEGFV